MSRENVEVVTRMYWAFNTLAQGGDVASHVSAFYHPDCEYQPVEEQDPVRGHDALVHWHGRWFEVWDEFRAEIDEVIDTGDVVMTGITVHGRGDSSGIKITQRLFHVSEVRDGTIVRMEEYLERPEALEAVGLQEQAMSRENVEVVRRIYESWNAGDVGLQHFDPAVELHQTADLLDTGGVFHGHEGVLASARELIHGLRDLHWKTHDLIAAPCGQVVVPFTARAAGRASAAPVEMSLVHVWTTRDGLAIRMLTYDKLSQALEAVGLRE